LKAVEFVQKILR